MTKAGIKKKAIAVKDARVNIHQSSERFEDDGIARTSSQERREARNSMSIGCPAHREAKKNAPARECGPGPGVARFSLQLRRRTRKLRREVLVVAQVVDVLELGRCRRQVARVQEHHVEEITTSRRRAIYDRAA